MGKHMTIFTKCSCVFIYIYTHTCTHTHTYKRKGNKCDEKLFCKIKGSSKKLINDRRYPREL